MSASAKILDRLDRPRQIRPGQWTAGCPCCQSRQGRPVAVRELDDGRVLLHAFCGCDTEGVLSALGLTLGDLFEKPLGHRLPPQRQIAGLSARDALALLSNEADVVALLASDAATGRQLTPNELQRLAQAAGRVGLIRDQAHA